MTAPLTKEVTGTVTAAPAAPYPATVSSLAVTRHATWPVDQKTFSARAKILSGPVSEHHRGFQVAYLKESTREAFPALRPKESRRIFAEMLRELLPQMSIEQRSVRAARILGVSPSTVRRLCAGETRVDAEHFLLLLRKLGVDRTIEIINRGRAGQ